MTTQRPKVLFIDDDPECRDAVGQLLDANGYTMVGAESAEMGLRAWSLERPDFVIVDLMMEEVDAGMRVVHELRAHGVGVPIFILSSVGDMLDLDAGRSTLGVAGIIQKPADARTLLAALRGASQPASTGEEARKPGRAQSISTST